MGKVVSVNRGWVWVKGFDMGVVLEMDRDIGYGYRWSE